jgi:hypothetical protein
VSCDHRQTHRHGFENDRSSAFVKAREHEHIERAQRLGDFCLRHEATEADTRTDAERAGERLEAVPLRTIAEDVER